jgi:hypothetical protein
VDGEYGFDVGGRPAVAALLHQLHAVYREAASRYFSCHRRNLRSASLVWQEHREGGFLTASSTEAARSLRVVDVEDASGSLVRLPLTGLRVQPASTQSESVGPAE